jgi:hypothetical protein
MSQTNRSDPCPPDTTAHTRLGISTLRQLDRMPAAVVDHAAQGLVVRSLK